MQIETKQTSDTTKCLLLANNNWDYWKEIKKICGSSRTVSTVVNGYTESKAICNEFVSKYDTLYNSVNSDAT